MRAMVEDRQQILRPVQQEFVMTEPGRHHREIDLVRPVRSVAASTTDDAGRT
jgi:hypothetical protein